MRGFFNSLLALDATEEEKAKVSKDLRKNLTNAIDTVGKYELRKAERVLEQLNVQTIELLVSLHGAPFVVRPQNGDPQATIAALKDVTVWDACLVRMQELRIVRTDLRLDDHQPRYSYHWTAVGLKVIDLIIKKMTPPPAGSLTQVSTKPGQDHSAALSALSRCPIHRPTHHPRLA